MSPSHRLNPCLLALVAALLPYAAQSQVIFSEYVEGSSNNKALELYNAGDTAVDLSQYTVEQYPNGASAPNATFRPSGMLNPGEVYVIGHGSLAETLGARMDLSANLAFNGDDALVLRQQGNVADRIGQVGFRPVDAWTGASGSSTKDQTLRRKQQIKQGDTAFDAPFDIDAEWDAYPINNFDGLGAHPGLAALEPEPGLQVQCGEPSTAIADLRTATGTPTDNVRVEAIVSASYTGDNGFSGFFLQTADSERLRRPGVSEGLFVYAPGAAIAAGQRVHVAGTVAQRFGQTQLTLTSEIAVCATGQAVTPEPMPLPLPALAEFSHYEGMLVSLPAGLTVNNVYELGRYGTIMLADGLLQTPTHAVAPGQAAQALLADHARRSLLLDDGLNNQNPSTIAYPAPGLSASQTLRRGYVTQTPVVGVVEMRYDAWRVQPIAAAQPLTFDATPNPRPEAPARAPDSDIRVAAFNVLNYFNGDGQGGGFPTSRGARSAEELQRQEDKIVAALRGLDADVIGLMEIENDGYASDSAIHQLTSRLGPNWRYVAPDVERLGSDEIAVALIYRSDAVREAGQPATLEIDDKNRVPLAQTFESLRGGLPVTVAVNHFKSKGCSNASGGDADQNDGQSCWNPTRVNAAAQVAAWLKTHPTGVEQAGQLIIGDLNSYAKEDPIRYLNDAGYTDLLARDGQGQAYTYVFNGMSGYLDHALADATLAARVRQSGTWSINADEPPALQYSLQYKTASQQTSLYAADAFASSDHDPVIVDLALANSTPPEENKPDDGATTPPSEISPPLSSGSDGGGAAGLGLLAALAWLGRRRLRQGA